VNPLSAIPSGILLPAVVGLVFVTLLVIGLLVFSPLFDYARHRRRVSQVEQFGLHASGVAPATISTESSLARAALNVSSRLIRSTGEELDIAERLDRAGMHIRPNEWLLLRAVACVVGGAVCILPFGPLIGIPIGALLGFGGTAIYRRVRTERRYQSFADQLPDALQLVIGSLRAGFSLPQAVDAMLREASDPISTEFSRALAETRLGADLEDALERLAVRMHNKDLAWTVVAIRIQRDVGGNLAEVLTTNVATMRERESLRRHVRALSAEGRLSAYLLTPLPVLAMLLMLIIRRAYVLPMFTTLTGLLLTVLALLLVAGGSFWMWRLVKVEI
jgi:tight adherence protein B